MKQTIGRLREAADYMHQLLGVHWNRMLQINFIHQYLNGWQRSKWLEVCGIHEVTWVLEGKGINFNRQRLIYKHLSKQTPDPHISVETSLEMPLLEV